MKAPIVSSRKMTGHSNLGCKDEYSCQPVMTHSISALDRGLAQSLMKDWHVQC